MDSNLATDHLAFESLGAWIESYGVVGSVVAAIAALICIVIGLNLFGQIAARFLEWRRKRGELGRISFGRLLVGLLWSLVLMFAAIGGGLALTIAAVFSVSPYLRWIVATILVVAIGGGVGAAELVSRYKDRPDSAIRTTPALFYVSLNALASVAALYLIYVWRAKLGFADKDGNWLTDAGTLVQAVLLAGFSSLLFFRTNLFKLRVGDSDLAVGPSIVLDSLLAAADRAVDRVMAEPRANFVHKIMKEVSFEKAAVILPGHCLALMQNVSSAESQRIAGVVNQLRADKEMPDKIKSLNLGLAILTVVGPKVLETAVKFLESDIQDTTSRLMQDVAVVMRSVSFERARQMLPRYCIALWPKPIPTEAEEKVKADVAALAALKDIAEEYKAILLGIWLARLTDGATLRKAVSDLGISIQTEGKAAGGAEVKVEPAEPEAAKPEGAKAKPAKRKAAKPEKAAPDLPDAGKILAGGDPDRAPLAGEAIVLPQNAAGDVDQAAPKPDAGAPQDPVNPEARGA